MIDLGLSELFGNNASQDSVNLIIKKADLIGLIPDSSNRAEELFVSILLTALSQFQGELVTENEEKIVTETGEALGFDNSEDYFLRVNYWRKNWVTVHGQSYMQHQLVVFEYLQDETV